MLAKQKFLKRQRCFIGNIARRRRRYRHVRELRIANRSPENALDSMHANDAGKGPMGVRSNYPLAARKWP